MVKNKEITVSKKFFSKYKTITKAIQNAAPGTKIFIEPNVYHESIHIDKDLELIGIGPANEVILYNEDSTVIEVQTKQAAVRGLTIRQGGEKRGNGAKFAIDVSTGSLKLEDCNISSDIGSGIRVHHLHANSFIQKCNIYSNCNSGIMITKSGNATIQNCKIYSNKMNGVHLSQKGHAVLENCEIYDNEYSNVYVASESNVEIRECEVFESKKSGIFVKEKGYGAIENCEIYGNGYANVQIEGEGDLVLTGCKIYEGKQNGVWIKEKGRGTIENCEIYRNEFVNVKIESEGNPTLRDCKIFESKENGVWVSEKGQGAIVDCEIYRNEYPNVGIESEGNPVLRSCKIFESKSYGLWIKERGQGVINDCEIYKNEETNIKIESKGNPAIKDCKIYESKQNGVWIKEQGQGRIEDCEIYRNKSSNINIESDGNPIIKNCRVYESEKFGLYVWKEGQGTIENSEICRNVFSNVMIKLEGNLVMKNCKVYESKQVGLYVLEEGRGLIENSEIYRNTLSNVKIKSEGSPILRNCKIYESKQNGLYVLEKGRGTIENCKIENNANKNTVVSEDSEVKVSHSAVKHEKKVEVKTQNHFNERLSNDLSKVLAQLDSFIGMENIKEQIRKTIRYIQFNQELAKRGLETENLSLAAAHTVLYGNPGTGKTTVARLLGKLYKAMGLLPSGHLVQVNREKLVGEYIGHTAPKTKRKIDEALGGVLFIDEAYELSNKESKNDFGPEAIGVILEEMENRKGKFIVVVAGYEKEMIQFLKANPGLQSRFSQYFHLQDYTPDELVKIGKKMVNEKKRSLSWEAEALLHKQFTALWRKRDRFFSNGRLVRNYIEGMLQAQAQRCMQQPKEQWTEAFLLTLTEEDVIAATPKEETKMFDLPINERLLSDALEKLHHMIGMNHVKTEIEKLVTLVRFYKEEGKDLTELSSHTLLAGSPGTGKTEVARIIAKIYEALGILERGDLVEVNRDKLVSSYSGESEKLITNYVEQAMGGTLFIDEAYQLTQHGPQDSGHKVIEVLLKYMEDRRGDFIVIVAGYKEKMEQFLDSNNGLRRRFSRIIEFEDYTPAELMQISEAALQDKGYRLDSEAHEKLFSYYQSKYESRDRTFGNAGFARNIVNETIKNLDYRVAKMPKEKRTQEIKRTISVVDINV